MAHPGKDGTPRYRIADGQMVGAQARGTPPNYLWAFPFDGLKIDRSFLNRLDESEDDKAIIRAIVGLGRALSLTVTAEGIETAEHLDLLKAVACDEGQGYYLSRPLDADSFNDLVSVTA